MVLWGITYESPSYLPLPPFSARSPFSFLHLCSAHPSILFLSPQIDLRLLNFHPPSNLFFPPHLSPADLVLLSTSPSVLTASSIFTQSLFAHVNISHVPSLSLFTVTPPLSFSLYIFQVFSLLQPLLTVLNSQLHSFQRLENLNSSTAGTLAEAQTNVTK